MLAILGLIAPLFGLIVLGYISGKLKKIPMPGLAWLNFFVIYISLPALFFLLLSRTPFEQFYRIDFLFRTTLGTFLIFALCLGPPMAIAAFGPEAAVPVALIFCLDNTMHFIFAPLLMSIGDNKKAGRLSLLFAIARSIVTHPFILATVAGMLGAWCRYVPPDPIENMLSMLSGAAAPCALFAMGVTAAMRPLKRIPFELAYLVPVKLVVHPLLMYFIVSGLTDLPDHWLYSAVLLAALPSATNVFVLAQQYDVWVERALSTVVISTLCSAITVTLVIYLAKNAGF